MKIDESFECEGMKFERGDLVLVEDVSLFLQERRKKENKFIGTVLEHVGREVRNPFYRVLLHGTPKRRDGGKRHPQHGRISLPNERNIEKL
jgi:hypothetical protein